MKGFKKVFALLSESIETLDLKRMCLLLTIVFNAEEFKVSYFIIIKLIFEGNIACPDK